MASDKLMSVYINKDLHKKVKLHCIKHDLGPMVGWVEKVLDIAASKPTADVRLQKLREEAIADGIAPDPNKTYKVVLSAGIKTGGGM